MMARGCATASSQHLLRSGCSSGRTDRNNSCVLRRRHDDHPDPGGHPPTPSGPSGTSTTTVERTALSVTVEVVTEIDAAPDVVWAVLTDLGAYPGWNPFITSLGGRLEVGEQLTAVLALDGQQPRTMRPRVVDVVPGRSFTWLGRIGLPRLFDGRHHFEVQALDGGRTRFVHRERLSGVLVPLFRSMLTGATPRSFVAMNEALAERAGARG
jgi:hypothetical protein